MPDDPEQRWPKRGRSCVNTIVRPSNYLRSDSPDLFKSILSRTRYTYYNSTASSIAFNGILNSTIIILYTLRYYNDVCRQYNTARAIIRQSVTQ